jgi:hypothetical protein
MTKDEALNLALEAAYLAGFNASGEGYNGEYGIDCPEENAIWKKDRDNELTAIKQPPAQPAPVQEPVLKPLSKKWKWVLHESFADVAGFDEEGIPSFYWKESVTKFKSGELSAPCKGKNCGSLNGWLHSSECRAEHEAQYTTPPAQPAPVQDLPFGVGGGLVAIKTLLSRDPCVHANTAIEMIDAILKEHPAAQPAPVQPVTSLKEVDVLMMAEAHGIDPSTNGLYGFYIDCISNQPAAQPAQTGD